MFDKTIAFKIDPDFHVAIKIQATLEKRTLQDYIISALKKDLAEKKTVRALILAD